MENAATISCDSSAVTSCGVRARRERVRNARGGVWIGRRVVETSERRRAAAEQRCSRGSALKVARGKRCCGIASTGSARVDTRAPPRPPRGVARGTYPDDFIVERVLPRLLRRAHVHERVQDVVQHDGGLVQEAAVPPRVPRVVPHDDASPQHRLERPRSTAAAASGACDAPERSLDAREAFDRTDPRAFASDWLRSRDRVSLRRALRARARAELVKHPSRLSFPSTPAAGEHDSRFDT